MGDEYPTVRAAAVQASPVFLDREASTEKACDLIAEAGENGADVIVFPEGFVPAHPLWFHFHPATGDVAQRLSVELFKHAVEVPGPATRRVAEAARQADAYVVLGVCEKRPDTTGTMYNSQLFFSPEGELLGKHQKIKPTVGEQLVHAEGNNDTFGTVESEYGPISGLICGENSNPLAVFAITAEYSRIHGMSWPPYIPSESNPLPERLLDDSRAFAQMSKAHVVSAAGVVDDETVEVLGLDRDSAERIRSPTYSGGSVIVGPGREIVAGPLENEETILYGTLDLEESVGRKLFHDFAGHYNRPDLFQLRMNRRRSELYAEAGRAATSASVPVPADSSATEPVPGRDPEASPTDGGPETEPRAVDADPERPPDESATGDVD